MTLRVSFAFSCLYQSPFKLGGDSNYLLVFAVEQTALTRCKHWGQERHSADGYPIRFLKDELYKVSEGL